MVKVLTCLLLIYLVACLWAGKDYCSTHHINRPMHHTPFYKDFEMENCDIDVLQTIQDLADLWPYNANLIPGHGICLNDYILYYILGQGQQKPLIFTTTEFPHKFAFKTISLITNNPNTPKPHRH